MRSEGVMRLIVSLTWIVVMAFGLVSLGLQCFLQLSSAGFAFSVSGCYTGNAEQAKQHPGPKTTVNPAQDNRKKQCRTNETKPNSNAIHARKRRNNPPHSHTRSRIKMKSGRSFHRLRRVQRSRCCLH